MKKGRIIVGLILNILILGCVGFAVSNVYFGYWNCTALGVRMFEYFTIDSNIILALVSLMMIFAEIAMLKGKKAWKFGQALKLTAVVGTTITAITTIAYLYPKNPTPENLALLYAPEYDLELHAIVPVLGIISIIVENQPRMKPWKYAFLGLVEVGIYAAVAVPLVNMGFMSDHYGFLKIDSAKPWLIILWLGGFLLAGYLIAFLLLLLHNIGAEKKAVEAAPETEKEGEELPPVNKVEPVPEEPEEVAEESEPEENPKDEAPPVEEPQVEEKPEDVTVLAPRTAYAHPKLKKVSNVRTYHITKQPNGEWQVKLAGGKKAIKLFPTQREAIAFARGLVESRGGSYRIHSVKGKIRS